MSLVRQDDLVNSECGGDSTSNERITYKSSMSGEDAECIKERYVRVAAIIIATIEGTKNSCVQEIIRTTRFRLIRMDVPS